MPADEVVPVAKQVWKFPLYGDGWVEMPSGSRLLHVAVQDGRPFLWAEVDSYATRVRRQVPIYATGESIEGSPAYVGTFHAGGMVLHVYSTDVEHALVKRST